MTTRTVGIAGMLLCLAGCGLSAHETAARSEATRQDTPGVAVRRSDHEGSLTAPERSLASTVARRQQRRVDGTFIGATAFATHGTPFDPVGPCDLDARFINVRLVWEADASFFHAAAPNSPPDGPRKALLVTVDPAKGHVCQTTAQYRDVGAGNNETLIYGEWPDPADG